MQTYTHWHAIMYLVLVLSGQQPWSPASERAWVALHSVWLIPPACTQSGGNGNGGGSGIDGSARIWAPLRKLMAKARRRREAELQRLRRDPKAAAQLEARDRRTPQPGSTAAPFPSGTEDSAERFRERWRRLVAPTMTTTTTPTPAPSSSSGPSPPPKEEGDTQRQQQQQQQQHQQQQAGLAAVYPTVGAATGTMGFGPVYPQPGLPGPSPGTTTTATKPHNSRPVSPGKQQQPTDLSHESAGPPPSVAAAADYHWPDAQSLAQGLGPGMGPGFGAWMWADGADPSVDVFADMGPGEPAGPDGNMNLDADLDLDLDWNSWVESARGMMEWSP